MCVCRLVVSEVTHAAKAENKRQVNSIKQIPFLKDILPSNLYASNKIKTFAKVLAFIYEVLTLFIWKLLYLMMIIIKMMKVFEINLIHYYYQN